MSASRGKLEANVKVALHVRPCGSASSYYNATTNPHHPNSHSSRHVFSRNLPIQVLANGYPTADFVQDLYIRELKAFKPTPIKASDADGHVQKFTPPNLPKSPQEDNIANDLKAYEDQQVEVEGQEASGAETMPEEDWFEEEDEVEAPAAH